MNAIAVIVARGGSKGVKLKNARPVGRIPMVSRAVIACREAREGLLDKIVVSTDHDEIAHYAKVAGAATVKRPDEISGDHARIEDAVRHAIRHVYGDRYPDAVAIVQPNLPVWQPRIIEAVLNMLFHDEGCTAVATAAPIKERPEWMSRLDADGYAHRWLHRDTKEAQRQELPELYHQDGQVVAVKMETFMRPSEPRYLGYVGNKLRLYVKKPMYCIDIDEEWEIAAAEGVLGWLKGEVTVGKED